LVALDLVETSATRHLGFSMDRRLGRRSATVDENRLWRRLSAAPDS